MFPSDVIDIGVTAEGLYYLEFSNVTEEDKGRYTVTATNDLGSCEADTQLRVVREWKPLYTLPSPNTVTSLWFLFPFSLGFLLFSS